MSFAPPAHHVSESAELRALRADVRAFIADEIASGGFVPAVDCWLNSWDEAFSRRLAARGWLGMTIPVEYGGHGRSFRERFVVTEELLAAGAPLAAHWISDRQIGPSLMKFGSEEQRRKLLPGIAKGEVFFAIGMSEPDSGSDLASPFCSQLASQWDEPWLLYVAALFHDVAKGRGGDHSELGLLKIYCWRA